MEVIPNRANPYSDWGSHWEIWTTIDEITEINEDKPNTPNKPDNEPTSPLLPNNDSTKVCPCVIL